MALPLRCPVAAAGLPPTMLAAKERRGAAETFLFGGGEAALSARWFGGQAGRIIGDADAPLAVDPEPGTQSIGIAGVAHPMSCLALRIVGAGGGGGRQLAGGEAVAADAVPFTAARPVAAIILPGGAQHRFDRLGRKNADAVQGSAVQQHPPYPGQAARRYAQPARGREERAIVAEHPAIEIARFALLDEHRAVGPLAVQI